MNAHSRTAFGIAAAVTGRPRAAQRVHVCRTTFGSIVRHVVLVTPAGSSSGDYYECTSYGLTALEAGMTPEELELDRFEDDADYSDFDHLSSQADADYQARKEAF